LKKILFENEYFGFEDAAQKYVDELFDDITKNLHVHIKKRAPKYFDKYGKGMYYAGFRKNKNTQWYVFFRLYRKNEENIYQIRYIANNHTIAQYL
jgi:histone deacetylase complex regulatory component SIN3